MKTIAVVQPSAELGGLEIGLWNWIRLIDPERYRRLVIVPHDGPIVAKLRSAGVEVRLLPMMQLRSLRSLSYQGRYLARFWPTVFRLSRLLRAEKVDLVHSNSLFCLYGGWAAKVARLPHVSHVHEIPDQPAVVTRGLTAMATRLSVRVIAVSAAVAAIFGDPNRQHDRGVVELTEGIDIERFSPDHAGDRVRADLEIPNDVLMVGWAGRLDPWKGAEVFIRAAAEVARANPDTRFAVFGGELGGYEAYAASLKTLAADLGLKDRLSFAGWRYGWDDMPEVMAALDVLVHTSIRPEPLGLVILEAMASGKPVVASNAGGPQEIVRSGVSGYLCEPGADQEFAAAVGRLLGSAELRHQMGSAARASVEARFDVRRYAAEIAAVYASVLGEG